MDKECLKKLWIWFNKSFLLLFLVLVSAFAFFDLMSWWWSALFFFKEDNGRQNLLLLLAFEAAFYYAYITHKMWQIDKDPVLRLQWYDIGTTDQMSFRKYKEIINDNDEKQDKKDTISYIYNSFTDLQLVNNGKAAARDLRIVTQYKNSNRVIDQLKNVTAMGPNGITQLSYLVHPIKNRGKVFNDKERSYKEPFEVIISYKDSQNLTHKIKFESDEKYNDGFRIV